MRKKYKGLLAIVCGLMICLTSNMGTVNAATEIYKEGWVQYGIPEGATSQTEFDRNKELSTEKFIYDEEGKIIRKEDWNKKKSKIYWTYTYHYDERGNLLQVVQYDSPNVIRDIDIYKYNEQGQIIEEGDVSSDGLYVPYYLYFYEGNKKLFWESCYEEVTEFEEYDSEGKRIAWQFENGGYPRRSEFTYDENGNVSQVLFMETYEKKFDKKIKYVYTYDAYGNIDTMSEYTFFEGRSETWMLNRAITYVKNYDEYGRLTKIGTMGFNGTFTGYTYSYE